MTCGRQRRACSKASSTLLPAAMLPTEKRSGKLSTRLSVLLPMEPVEATMVMRFMRCLTGAASFGKQLAVRTHVHQSQSVLVGPLIDQQKVGFQVAFAMIFPIAA